MSQALLRHSTRGDCIRSSQRFCLVSSSNNVFSGSAEISRTLAARPICSESMRSIILSLLNRVAPIALRLPRSISAISRKASLFSDLICLNTSLSSALKASRGTPFNNTSRSATPTTEFPQRIFPFKSIGQALSPALLQRHQPPHNGEAPRGVAGGGASRPGGAS